MQESEKWGVSSETSQLLNGSWQLAIGSCTIPVVCRHWLRIAGVQVASGTLDLNLRVMNLPGLNDPFSGLRVRYLHYDS